MTSPKHDPSSGAWSFRFSENNFDLVRLVAAGEVAVRHALHFLALGALSWRFVERPVLRRKRGYLQPAADGP